MSYDRKSEFSPAEKPRRQMSLRFEDESLRKDDLLLPEKIEKVTAVCSDQGSFAKQKDNNIVYEEGDDILTYGHKGTPRTINLKLIGEEKYLENDESLNKIQQNTNPWHWPEPLANPCDLPIICDDDINLKS